MDINERMRLNQWAQDMADQKASGLTVKQWCLTHSKSESTYTYHCRKVKRAMIEAEEEICAVAAVQPNELSACPEFSKVTIENRELQHSGISLDYKNAHINISPDATTEHVRLVLEALCHA